MAMIRLKVLSLLVLCITLVTVSVAEEAFDCVRAAEHDMRNDETILDNLKRKEGPVAVDCLASLLRGNHFKSAEYAIDTLAPESIEEAIEATRLAT